MIKFLEIMLRIILIIINISVLGAIGSGIWMVTIHDAQHIAVGCVLIVMLSLALPLIIAYTIVTWKDLGE